MANGGARRWGTDIGVAADIEQVRDRRLRELLERIESEPLQKIQDCALAFKLSQSHLQHLFKQATGVGLGHVLYERRLQRAAKLLRSTDMSVKEIAGAVGYSHSSSFTRAFERRFNRAPLNFRTESSSVY